MPFRKGYRKAIDDRFSVHIASDNEEELRLILDLNNQVHSEGNIKNYIRKIMQEYPRKDEIYWLYIKDNENGIVISSLCLSPLKYQIEKIEIPVCEMEFVGTIESYRRKGFIRFLNDLYENLMEQEGFIFSVIRGIPYFYRTLGYDYVSSLDERIRIQGSKIPQKTLKNLSIRLATSKDITLIKSKYSEFHEKFLIYNKFDEECFKFKYFNDVFDSEVRSTYIIEENGFPINYFSLGKSFDHQFYEIICPDLNTKEAIAILQFVKKNGNYQNNDILTLSVSKHTSLFHYMKSLGGELISDYGWQVKIPNLYRFLSCIKKVINIRLERSKYKELTKRIEITNYQETVELDIRGGKVIVIKQLIEDPPTDKADLSIPGGFIFMLFLGDKSFDEINYIAKDAYIDPSSKKLIEIIFPKKPCLFESYI
jgi:hypothetical protein